jgi:hypothetical protein
MKVQNIYIKPQLKAKKYQKHSSFENVCLGENLKNLCLENEAQNVTIGWAILFFQKFTMSFEKKPHL